MSSSLNAGSPSRLLRLLSSGVFLTACGGAAVPGPSASTGALGSERTSVHSAPPESRSPGGGESSPNETIDPNTPSPQTGSVERELDANAPPDETREARAARAFTLAERYSSEPSKDPVRALQALRVAANLDHLPAVTELGRLLMLEHADEHRQEGLRLLRGAAENGHPHAQHLLGAAYVSGRVVPKDPTLGMSWVAQAAEAGHLDAQCLYGTALRDGVGVAKDPAAAVQWFEMAQSAGNAEGMYLLGHAYSHGVGVQKDRAKSLKLYRSSAQRGYARAQAALGLALLQGDGVPKNEVEAVEWFKKAAAQGNVAAQFHLGVCSSFGRGIPKDEGEAAAWYRLAANAGDRDAQFNLALMYEHGRGVAEEQTEAAAWYAKAADQGHPGAQNNLGWFYEHGVGVALDLDRAVALYKQAAEGGEPVAQWNVGRCYENGIAVQGDEAEARRWFQRAAANGNEAAKTRLSELDARSKCERSASTSMFDVKLKCARRAAMRRALKTTDLVPKREDDGYWYDTYETKGVLPESDELQIGYTSEDGRLAVVRYVFGSLADVQQVARIRDLAARKYGRPHSSRGVVQVGEVSYGWSLADGVQLRVFRNWPATTTYMEYSVPAIERLMESEMKRNDRLKAKRELEEQKRYY